MGAEGAVIGAANLKVGVRLGARCTGGCRVGAEMGAYRTDHGCDLVHVHPAGCTWGSVGCSNLLQGAHLGALSTHSNILLALALKLSAHLTAAACTNMPAVWQCLCLHPPALLRLASSCPGVRCTPTGVSAAAPRASQQLRHKLQHAIRNAPRVSAPAKSCCRRSAVGSARGLTTAAPSSHDGEYRRSARDRQICRSSKQFLSLSGLTSQSGTPSASASSSSPSSWL